MDKKLGRMEAIGIMVVITLYICSMLASYSNNPQLFQTQMLYFSIITFCLVVLILAFDQLTLECARISKYVIAGVIVSSIAMFALVNFIAVNPSILQIAALSSVVPTVGMAVYQVMFIGVGEGILHFVFIRLSYAATKNWGIAIFIGSGILGMMHFAAVGFVPITLLFLGVIFVVIAALSMTPALLGGKVKFSLIISAVVHMVYNMVLITVASLVGTGVT